MITVFRKGINSDILYLVFTLHYRAALSYNWLLGQDCNLAGSSSLSN